MPSLSVKDSCTFFNFTQSWILKKFDRPVNINKYFTFQSNVLFKLNSLGAGSSSIWEHRVLAVQSIALITE